MVGVVQDFEGSSKHGILRRLWTEFSEDVEVG